MKISTTFHGNALLFESDLALRLRAIPAGARITRAMLNLQPDPDPSTERLFHEYFPVDDDGNGPFGLLVQAGSGPAIVDLGTRRTVEAVRVTNTAINTVQIDMGGMWLLIDANGNPIQSPGVGGNFTITNQELALPNVTTQRLRLNETNQDVDVLGVSLVSYPSNLTLRLGNIGPFWFRLGDLRAAASTPDFAEILNAFLQRSVPVDLRMLLFG